jgi:hypothetical protein
MIPEIHEEIFDHLDPIDSACLGLTCKIFYKIHRKRHRTVTLNKISLSPPHALHYRLQQWIGPLYAFDYLSTKFRPARKLRHRSFLDRKRVSLYKEREQIDVDIQNTWVVTLKNPEFAVLTRVSKLFPGKSIELEKVDDCVIVIEVVDTVTEDDPTEEDSTKKKSAEKKPFDMHTERKIEHVFDLIEERIAIGFVLDKGAAWVDWWGSS